MLTELKRDLRKKEFFWRYLFNFKPSVSYTLGGKKSDSPVVKRIVSELKKNGLAFSSIDELFPDKTLFTELQQAIDTLEQENKAMIDHARETADDKTSIDEKTFMMFLLGSAPKYDENSIFSRFAKQHAFKEIADGYYDMDADLRYYNVWHTVPYLGPARTSQLWHRDREDLQILKIFVYLTDVDEGAGPFTYAPGTHLLGNVKTEPEYHMENGVKRTVDEQMDKVVPKEKWVTAIVPKYTVVFADTHGYHKGGLAREHDRLLYTCMYTSPGCQRFLFS